MMADRTPVDMDITHIDARWPSEMECIPYGGMDGTCLRPRACIYEYLPSCIHVSQSPETHAN